MRKYRLNFKRLLTDSEAEKLGQLLSDIGLVTPEQNFWVLMTDAPPQVFRVLLAQEFSEVYEGLMLSAD